MDEDVHGFKIHGSVGVRKFDCDVPSEGAWFADCGGSWQVSVHDGGGMACHVGVPAGSFKADAVVVWWGDFVAGVVVSGFVPPGGERGRHGGSFLALLGLVLFLAAGAHEVFTRGFAGLEVVLLHWNAPRSRCFDGLPEFYAPCGSVPQSVSLSSLWPSEAV